MNVSLKLISSLVVATAASLVSFSSVAAETSDGDAAYSRGVKMWDLDLANSEDVQTLYERVREAANEVCRAEARRHLGNTRRPVPLGWTERCADDAVEAAVREVGNRRLATLHTSGSRVLLWWLTLRTGVRTQASATPDRASCRRRSRGGGSRTEPCRRDPGSASRIARPELQR